MNTAKYFFLILLSVQGFSALYSVNLSQLLSRTAQTWGIKHVLTHRREAALTLSAATALYSTYTIGDRYSLTFRKFVSLPAKRNLKRYIQNLIAMDKKTVIGTGAVISGAAAAYYYRNELYDKATALIAHYTSTKTNYEEQPVLPSDEQAVQLAVSGEDATSAVLADEELLAEARKLRDGVLEMLAELRSSERDLYNQINDFIHRNRYPDLDPTYFQMNSALGGIRQEIVLWEEKLSAFGDLE